MVGKELHRFTVHETKSASWVGDLDTEDSLDDTTDKRNPSTPKPSGLESLRRQKPRTNDNV